MPISADSRALQAEPWQWRIFELAGWNATLFLLVMQRHRVGVGFLTSYGTDLLFPAFLYLLMRGNRTLWKKLRPAPPGPLAAALAVFAAGLVWELSQRAHLTRGTYDPLDLLAYAVSLAFAFGIDRAWRTWGPQPA